MRVSLVDSCVIGFLCVAPLWLSRASAEGVTIVTEPEGARVSLGDVPLGVTSSSGLRLAGLEPGDYTYSIRKDGHVAVERAVRVSAGSEPTTVVVRLQKLPSAGDQQTAL